MAMKSSSTDTEELKCPVCRQPFTQPKILPCAHLMCRDCLVKRLKAKPDAQCPYCRLTIQDPGAGLVRTPEALADTLPTDLAMVALVDSAQKVGQQHTCQACLKVPTVSICLSCGDLMCHACATGHLNMSFAKNHLVEALAGLTAEKLAASRPIPCSIHNDQPCRLFCPTHGASICQVCVKEKHRKCTEVTELESKLREARTTLSDLTSVLSVGEGKVEQAVVEMDRHLIDTEQHYKASLADIDAACNRLQNSVEACRRRMVDMALVAKSDVVASVRSAKSFLLDRSYKLAAHRRVVERAMLTSPRASLTSMTSTLKSRVDDLDRSTDLPLNHKAISKATIFIDPAAISRIEEELADLGDINLVDAPLSAKPQPALRFHVNHGRRISLSNNRQTAEMSGEGAYGVVVSADEMLLNRLYEIRVDEVDNNYSSPSGLIFAGAVATSDPTIPNMSSVTWALELTTAYVIWDTTVQSMGKQIDSKVGAALTGVGPRGRVGVMVDYDGCLHLYVNGKDQGVAARGVRTPCYAFFDLSYYWRKVTGLPVRLVGYDRAVTA